MPGTKSIKKETKALTGATAPSATDDADATYGIDVSKALGVACVVSAESSRTISGGTMQGYARMPVDAYEDGTVKTWRWMRHSALDWTPGTGARSATSGDFEGLTGVGRVAWVPNLTASGGTNCDICLVVRRRSS